ncbi:glycoside hydrolase family 6 protein [Cellulomonas xiejunii]|uniref:glycoside hydrolase family 6 protein n=1 Tax=Cellulomonas xiejunii TaxID=2968083 RepID=UPI003556E7F3
MSYLATASSPLTPLPASLRARRSRRGRLGDARLLSGAAQGGAARWLTDSGTPTGRVGAAVAAYVEQAQVVGQTPVLVPYAVPNRDNGSHSAGGYPTSGYMAWTVEIVEALRGSRAVVLLEPDSAAGDAGTGPAEPVRPAADGGVDVQGRWG